MLRRLYPGGKDRAFNITYDDGVMQDLRFVELMNRYGLKGTFNLNSELMKTGFAWTHPNGMEVKRLNVDTARWLYRGHEIASHTRNHPYLDHLHEEDLRRELLEDKQTLEALFGVEVAGFAVPFDYYSAEIADCARECGFEYARMSEFSHDYAPCRDWYFWKTGFYHIQPGLSEYVEGFLNTSEELAVCQIVGHSYDLDAHALWEVLERIMEQVSKDPRIWSCTNLELVRYLKAMDQADLRENEIRNVSAVPLWFQIGEDVVMLNPGEMMKL